MIAYENNKAVTVFHGSANKLSAFMGSDKIYPVDQKPTSPLTVFSKSGRPTKPSIYDRNYVTLSGSFTFDLGAISGNNGNCIAEMWYKTGRADESGSVTIKLGPYKKAKIILKCYNANGNGSITISGDFGSATRSQNYTADFVATAEGDSLTFSVSANTYNNYSGSWSCLGVIIDSIVLYP